MSDNIIQSALKKLRPGSGGKQKGVSIIDTVGGRAPTHRRPTLRPATDEPNPEESNYPIALSSSRPLSLYPSGLLEGVDPETGKIPRYEPDDAKVLNRLFNLGVTDD